MTNEALKALDEIEICIKSILGVAHNNGVTALAKWKFEDQIKTIRSALTREAVDVDLMGVRQDIFNIIYPLMGNVSASKCWLATDYIMDYLAAQGHLTATVQEIEGLGDALEYFENGGNDAAYPEVHKAARAYHALAQGQTPEKGE